MRARGGEEHFWFSLLFLFGFVPVGIVIVSVASIVFRFSHGKAFP